VLELLRNGTGRRMERVKMNGLGNDGWMEIGKGVPPLQVRKAKGGDRSRRTRLPIKIFLFFFDF
jgi:hypothetical protein